MRLLLETSSASSGSFAGWPVTASTALSSWTMKTPVGGRLDRVVEQRLRERGQAGIGPRHRVLQRRDARVAVADGDRARLGRVERPGRSGDRAEHREQTR